jgi:hypothetical protein
VRDKQAMRPSFLSIRMVAGYSELIGAEQFLVAEACNHPNCLVLPFSVELIRLAA